jgi:hypothetical protein
MIAMRFQLDALSFDRNFDFFLQCSIGTCRARRINRSRKIDRRGTVMAPESGKINPLAVRQDRGDERSAKC